MAVTVVNLVLTVIILLVGIWAYAKKKAGAALLIGLAFGLFAVSHLLTLLDLADTLKTPLIIIRILGYLVVILAVYGIGTRD